MVHKSLIGDFENTLTAHKRRLRSKMLDYFGLKADWVKVGYL